MTGEVHNTPRPGRIPPVSAERLAQFSAVMELVQSWARRRPDIHAVGLAGSWARNAQRLDSDADIVVLTTCAECYVHGVGWIRAALGQDAPLTRTRRWGPVTERRLVLPSGFELEFGFAGPAWAETDPVDPGTARVVADGFRIVHDPYGALERLVTAVRAE